MVNSTWISAMEFHCVYYYRPSEEVVERHQLDAVARFHREGGRRYFSCRCPYCCSDNESRWP